MTGLVMFAMELKLNRGNRSLASGARSETNIMELSIEYAQRSKQAPSDSEVTTALP